jgi:hypothetical protein
MDPESPRAWDNFGTMACWHGRYNLGDEQPDDDPLEHMAALVDEIDGTFIDTLHDIEDAHFEKSVGEYDTLLDAWREIRRQTIEEHFEKHYISLPLYLYDHSGITISTGSFHCPWDSGQVGFIYVSRKDAEKELYPADSYPREFIRGDNVDWFSSLQTHVETIFKAEVETYDQFLRGDVWGFVLEENGEEIDSCWGFYGHDWRENGISDHVNIDEIDEVWYMEPDIRTVMEPADKEILNEQ